jgi:hypothetical protein
MIGPFNLEVIDVKPKVFLIEQKEQGKWGERGKTAMTFDEAMKLIHDLQNGLSDLRVKERETGGRFYLILVE